MIKQITSLSNDHIKLVVDLHDAKGRKAQKRFIVQTQNAIDTALQGNLKIDHMYATQDYLDYAQSIIDNGSVTLVSDAILKKISTLATPCGVIGIFHIPDQPSLDLLSPGLVCAQIADPGNLGTLIRTAAACNLKTVVCVETVDPWSPKVIQSTVGTISLLNVFTISWQELIEHKRHLALHALVVSDGKPASSIDPTKALLVVGSEAHGIKREWLADCSSRITLPMPGGTESLNAAVAGSIAMYITFMYPKKN